MTRDLSEAHFWVKGRTKIKALFETVLTDDKILENEKMKNHTTFRIGGRADLLLMPSDENEVCEVLKICRKEGLEHIVIGNGSNLLVSDKGIRGVVIKLGKSFADISVNGCEVSARAGALLSGVAAQAASHSLTGLEFAAGIPGTLGGAVYMNAGAYGGEMSNVVTQTTYIDKDCSIKTATEHAFSYRKSIFQSNGGIILSVKMLLRKGDKSTILGRMEELGAARREKQPLNFPSAGSVFKRPEGFFAGKLIQDAGLMGYSVGGAAVSEKHAGFIINRGGATAQDVLDLIEYIKKTVYERFGVSLECEIRLIGER